MAIDISPYYQQLERHAVLRVVGSGSLEHGVEYIIEGIEKARKEGAKRLMVVTTDWDGASPPSLATRFFLAREWAAAAGGRIRLALVVRPEMVDPQKFAMTVARNAGLVADTFTAEGDALAWLLSDVDSEANGPSA